MAAPVDGYPTPLYGDKDAELRNFRQKHRPPQTFLDLVDDDKKVSIRILSISAQRRI